MRIGFFGNGSLGDGDATVRDGTVADRRALFDALTELGHEAVYLAPKERTPSGDLRVVGYRWRGGLDALVIESRDAAFAPVIVPKESVHGAAAKPARKAGACPSEGGRYEREDGYARFCLECTELSLYDVGAIPVFPQAEVARDWALGAFDRVKHRGEAGPDGVCKACPCPAVRPMLLLWDFDLNVRRVWGLSGRTSVYETGAFWRGVAPWMTDVLTEVRQGGRMRVLAPYVAEWSDLYRAWGRESKADRSSGRGASADSWSIVDRFDWAYPLWLEDWRVRYEEERERAEGVPSLDSWMHREWDMVYSGSDYNRRRRFNEMYVGPARRGLRVAVTGVWGDRRRSQEDAPWDATGYRSWLAEATDITFLGGTQKQMRFVDMLSALADARVAVQITPDDYSRMGYYTNRVAECVALGVPVFIDREFARGDTGRLYEVGGLEDWFTVGSTDDVMDRFQELALREDSSWHSHVMAQRMALLERNHPRLVASRLLEAAGLGRGSGQ